MLVLVEPKEDVSTTIDDERLKYEENIELLCRSNILNTLNGQLCHNFFKLNSSKEIWEARRQLNKNESISADHFFGFKVFWIQDY